MEKSKAEEKQFSPMIKLVNLLLFLLEAIISFVTIIVAIIIIVPLYFLIYPIAKRQSNAPRVNYQNRNAKKE